jgi:hypothetical protein
MPVLHVYLSSRLSFFQPLWQTVSFEQVQLEAFFQGQLAQVLGLFERVSIKKG